MRFFLPALAACTVLGGIAVARLAGFLPALVRGAAGVALVAATTGLGVGFAREHGTFDLHRQEERYRVVADWVREHTSPDDLVLAAQHSGSIWHTGRRRVVRWDLLDAGDDGTRAPHARACAGRKDKPDAGPTPWLDHVVAYGVATWLVVDADEEPAFRARFQQASRCGLLDWPPFALTDPPSSVRVYRLSDRVRHLSGESWTPQRIAAAPALSPDVTELVTRALAG